MQIRTGVRDEWKTRHNSNHRIAGYWLPTGILSGNTGLPIRAEREADADASDQNATSERADARAELCTSFFSGNSRGAADALASAGRMEWAMKPKTCLFWAMAYTLSPIDLSIFYAPDFVPFAGQIDDALFDLLMFYLAFRRKEKR